jgi:hypothetical protein
VSNVKWCDLGQHAFPENQPGSTQVSLTEQVKNQWGGYQPTGVVQDICAACAKDAGYRGMKNAAMGDMSQDEADAQAEAIRDGTFRSKFGKKPKAISNGASPEKVEAARAKGYDPEYSEALQYMIDNPDWKPPWEKSA